MAFNYLELAKKLQDIMEENVSENLHKYVDHEGYLSTDTLENDAFDLLLEQIKGGLSKDASDILDDFIDDFRDTVLGYVENSFYDKLRISCREIVEEEVAYQSNPMKYNGLNQSDFIWDRCIPISFILF